MGITRRGMAALLAVIPGIGAARAQTLGVGTCGPTCPADLGWGCDEWGDPYIGPHVVPRCTKRHRRRNRKGWDANCVAIGKARCEHLCIDPGDLHRCA